MYFGSSVTSDAARSASVANCSCVMNAFASESLMMYAISGYNGATGAYGNPLNVLLAYSVDGK